MNDRIGELLVQKDLLSAEQLQQAKEQSKATGSRLGLQLTKMKLIDEATLAGAVSERYGVPAIELDDFEISAEVIALIPEDVAMKHTILRRP